MGVPTKAQTRFYDLRGGAAADGSRRAWPQASCFSRLSADVHLRALVVDPHAAEKIYEPFPPFRTAA